MGHGSTATLALSIVDCFILSLNRSYKCGPGPWWQRTPDMEIDAARLSAILNLQKVFTEASDPNVCFDVDDLKAKLQTVFKPGGHIFVPYGIGTYNDYDAISEYLAIPFAQVNHGFWFDTYQPNVSLGGILEVSPDGRHWVQGGYFSGTFLDGEISYTDKYIEQTADFEGCETLVNDYEIVATDGMRDWGEFMALARRTRNP